jgi:hypothetical protein
MKGEVPAEVAPLGIEIPHCPDIVVSDGKNIGKVGVPSVDEWGPGSPPTQAIKLQYERADRG